MNGHGRWGRPSLSRQLVTVIGVLFLLFGLTLSTLTSRQESSSLYAALQTTARNDVQLLAPSFVNQILRADITGMRESVAAVAQQKGVVDVFVLDSAGRKLLDSGTRQSQALDRVRRTDAFDTELAVIVRHGSLLDAVRPLVAGHTRVGTLVIGYDFARVQHTVAVNGERNLVTGLAFSILAALVTWLLLRHVALRLAAVTGAAHSAAEDQLPAMVRALGEGADPAMLAPPPLRVVRDDEIGRLAAALNFYRSVVVDMAAKLSAAANSSEATLQRAFDSSPIGMATAEADGRLLDVNPALCAMLGRSRAHLVGWKLESFWPNPQTPAGGQPGWSHLDGQVTRCFLRPDGATVWALQATSREPPAEQHTGRLLIQLVDTTRQHQTQQELTHLAFHDPLTGLANRALMQDRLDHALAARPPRKVSVLLLDLDDFKSVNDISGHAAGDRLLVEVAHRLQNCVRPGDTVARLGGDEFSVLLEDSMSAESAAKRVLGQLEVAVTLEGRLVVPAGSIGIAQSDHGMTGEDMMRRADTAMYAAKAAGKGRYEFFQEHMAQALLAKTDLEVSLRGAVSNGEIVVHYQPIIGVSAQQVVQVEALVRWQRPGHGLVPPTDFLPLAEQTGLILAIGQEVLSQACLQMAPWLRDGADRSVAVNVSTAQLAQPTFGQTVLDTLEQAGLEPRHLVLEVTESMVLDADPRSLGQLSHLRLQGVRVAIDDFGTGYSSLGRLHTLPVDSLKIDKMFVDEIHTGHEKLTILTSMIAMAHNLGLDVTAEGVETAEQATRLMQLRCDHLQGYHFARPQPLGELLAAGRLNTVSMVLFGTTAAHTRQREPVVVLVIDTDGATRTAIAASLAGHGFTVHEAASLTEGRRLARALRPDCVLIDLTDPDTRAVNLMRQLRRDRAHPPAVIVGLTARGQELTHAAGADDYLVKPVKTRHLADRLRNTLQAARAAGQSARPAAPPFDDLPVIPATGS